jgi:hypothetical protein
MGMPGFTAAATLRRTTGFYGTHSSSKDVASRSLIAPQQSFGDCMEACGPPFIACATICLFTPWPISGFCEAACLGVLGVCQYQCANPASSNGSSGYGCYETCVQAGGDPSACQTSCGYQPAPPPGCCVFNKDGTCRQRCRSGQQTP